MLPRWTMRLVLILVGAWLLADAGALALRAVNTMGAVALDPVPSGPSSWRPAQPLGALPDRVDSVLVRVAPLLLIGLVALGLAMWPDRRERSRFLVLFACLDVAILVAAYQALTLGDARTNAQAYALHQASVAPFVAIVVALAWPSRRARGLALAGAGLLALTYATVYWLDSGFPPGHWMATSWGIGAFSVARDLARAAAPALMGAGLLLTARVEPLRGLSASRTPSSPDTRS